LQYTLDLTRLELEPRNHAGADATTDIYQLVLVTGELLLISFVALSQPRSLRVTFVQDYRRGLETLFSKLEQV
jgi:hypothetical protein